MDVLLDCYKERGYYLIDPFDCYDWLAEDLLSHGLVVPLYTLFEVIFADCNEVGQGPTVQERHSFSMDLNMYKMTSFLTSPMAIVPAST
jgi:hypothetical protein